MALADCHVSSASFRLQLQPAQPSEMEKDCAGIVPEIAPSERTSQVEMESLATSLMAARAAPLPTVIPRTTAYGQAKPRRR